MRRSRFDVVDATPGSVVLLGDSITEQGIWHEWLPQFSVLNRGVAGETIGDVISRVEVVRGARAVSLMVGTNDLGGLGATRRVAGIAVQYEHLLTRLRQANPAAPLIITSVLPREVGQASRVRELNDCLIRLCRPYEAIYVDAWSRMHGSRYELRGEFTKDRVHLNGAGYREWLTVLSPALQEATAQ
ncbi:GDSL-type esterase/lipase family protein [Microbacterium sp. NPDC056044]|uniref:GDSL-type esterase/lipase family protein n=1 Tax=Microbacterium sp. NPDC056044 TaxID=3345690 RepID=UPI0035DB0245